jgi:hypothetical protein
MSTEIRFTWTMGTAARDAEVTDVSIIKMAQIATSHLFVLVAEFLNWKAGSESLAQ